MVPKNEPMAISLFFVGMAEMGYAGGFIILRGAEDICRLFCFNLAEFRP